MAIVPIFVRLREESIKVVEPIFKPEILEKVTALLVSAPITYCPDPSIPVYHFLVP